MDAELSAVVGFAVAAAATTAATPLAMRVARCLDFLDHPRQYRKHEAPTPLLGGAALALGLFIAAVAIGGVSGKHVLLLLAAGMLLIGTLDDRFAIPPRWRLLFEALAAAALVWAGLGWHTPAGDALDFILTVIWVAAVVNAFNLMDNLDGACATVGGVCAAGIGTLAAIHNQPAIAGLSFALAGACSGFLPFNLAGPARIFLGDGGSMLVGFLVASLSMALGRNMKLGDANIVAVAIFAGLPILDTALVSVSRTRRRVTLVTGGRDHLTHRLLLVLHSPRQVAAVLAVTQGALSALAIISVQLGRNELIALVSGLGVAGVIAIAVLDRPRWRPAGIAVSERRREPVSTTGQVAPSPVTIDS